MVKTQPAASCEDCQAKKLSIFCEIKSELVAQSNKTKQVRSWSKREILFYEGTLASGAFCIRSGKVKVYKVGSEGKPLILKVACPGDVLGLEALFNGQHYSFSAEMLEEGDVCWIDRSLIVEALQADLNLTYKIIKKLATDLVACQEDRLDMAQLSVRERLARLLLSLGNIHGADTPKGRRITLMLSREELSEMVGTAPETVMRLLKDFREDGLLQVARRELVICNPSGLMRAASLKLTAGKNPS